MKNTLEDKIIVYDSSCYLCNSGARLTLEYSSLTEKNLSAYDDLESSLKEQVDHSIFQNEMAVIDLGKNKTLYGLEGILFVTGTKFKILNKIKPGSFIFRVINLFYRIVAYNRYILFPINSNIKCSCEPPLNVTYRKLLFTTCIIISILISTMLGYVIGVQLNEDVVKTILYTLAGVSAPWIIQSIGAVIYLEHEKYYDYLGHLGVIMITGVIILIPALTTIFVPAKSSLILISIFILISFITMIRMHNKRSRKLGLKSSWRFSLFLFMQLSAIGTIYFYRN